MSAGEADLAYPNPDTEKSHTLWKDEVVPEVALPEDALPILVVCEDSAGFLTLRALLTNNSLLCTLCL